MSYPQWRDAFATVLDRQFYTIEWLDEQVDTGRAFFWCTPNAAILAEIKVYPTGAKDMHGLLAVGCLNDVIEHLIPAAEQFGRSNGCVGALIESREGWSRALRCKGYQPFQTSIRKALNGTQQQ